MNSRMPPRCSRWSLWLRQEDSRVEEVEILTKAQEANRGEEVAHYP